MLPLSLNISIFVSYCMHSLVRNAGNVLPILYPTVCIMNAAHVSTTSTLSTTGPHGIRFSKELEENIIFIGYSMYKSGTHRLSSFPASLAALTMLE